MALWGGQRRNNVPLNLEIFLKILNISVLKNQLIDFKEPRTEKNPL